MRGQSCEGTSMGHAEYEDHVQVSGGVRPDKEERDAGICAHARQQRNAGYRTEGVVSAEHTRSTRKM